MNKPPVKVGVSLRSGFHFTADILHGIVDYARQHAHWLIVVDSYFHFGHRPTKITPDWQGDAVILLGGDNEFLESDAFRDLKIPMINVTGWEESYPDAPMVYWDDAKIAELAAQHLVAQGLKRFGYVGPGFFPPSLRRSEAFRQYVGGVAESFHALHWTRAQIKRVSIWDEQEWCHAERLFKQWLRTLPPPIGILANNDITASLLINIAQEMGLKCPGDVVVVGFLNDPVICESTSPTVSSIQLDFKQVGTTAASILDRMLRSARFRPPKRTLIGPKGLIKRDSTDYLCFDDELIGRALRYIRKTAPVRPLSVKEVLQTVPMSRSSFAERFVKATGVSAKAEILRVRLEQVKRLLRTTDWTITRITDEMQFDSSHDLSRLFHLKTGMSPSRFRAQAANAKDRGIEE
jgi:LacI family transcriptional regulator